MPFSAIVYSRVAKVEVGSGVRFMRVGREIGDGKREVHVDPYSKTSNKS